VKISFVIIATNHKLSQEIVVFVSRASSIRQFIQGDWNAKQISLISIDIRQPVHHRLADAPNSQSAQPGHC
jgi:hypothetical protein